MAETKGKTLEEIKKEFQNDYGIPDFLAADYFSGNEEEDGDAEVAATPLEERHRYDRDGVLLGDLKWEFVGNAEEEGKGPFEHEEESPDARGALEPVYAPKRACSSSGSHPNSNFSSQSFSFLRRLPPHHGRVTCSSLRASGG